LQPSGYGLPTGIVALGGNRYLVASGDATSFPPTSFIYLGYWAGNMKVVEVIFSSYGDSQKVMFDGKFLYHFWVPTIGGGAHIRKMDWSGNVIWDITSSTRYAGMKWQREWNPETGMFDYGNRYYQVNNSNDALITWALEGGDDKLIKSVSFGVAAMSNPTGVSTDGKHIFIVNGSSKNIFVIDQNAQLLETIALGGAIGAPKDVDFDGQYFVTVG